MMAATNRDAAKGIVRPPAATTISAVETRPTSPTACAAPNDADTTATIRTLERSLHGSYTFPVERTNHESETSEP